MLDALRKAAGTWVAKLLLVLLVLSFAVWGISGSMLAGVGGNVVVAGDTKVTALDYRLAYDRQLSILSQRFGGRITREQAQAFGIDGQVLSQLVAGAVLDEQAREMRLGLSKDRLAVLTREDAAFQGQDGQFDRQQFDYVLRQIGMRPEDYLVNRAQVAMRQQIVEAVSDGMKAPDAFLRAVALYQGEDRTVDYLVLPRALVEPVADPAADVLAAWFETRKESYAAPEYRKLSYVKLEPSDIADPTQIADEAIRADYERDKAKFTTAETRTIEQLVFTDQAAATAALDSTRSGATFEDLVIAQGRTLDDVKLGTFVKTQMPDQAVAEAAFALQPNQLSPVVAGAFGPVILRVTALTPEVVKTFEEVREQIRSDLALAEASRILLEVHDDYEDARAGGESLAEAAEKLKLKVVTVDAVDRAARRPDGTVIADLPQSQDLLRAAFEAEADVENPAINIGSNGFLFYQVDGVTAGRPRPLEEVREKVIADWKVAETTTRLQARAAELQKQLSDGKPFEEIAASLSLEKQTKRGLKRAAEDPDLGAAGVAAAFGVKEGAAGTAPAPSDGAQIVFRVTEVFEPAGAGPETLEEDARRSFSGGMAEDLLDQLVARLQSEYDVGVDQAAIARALVN